MGVNLSDLVSGKTIELSDLKGKTIAIDAYNTLYQFLSIIRDRFTGEPLRDREGRITSHLSGLFYRTANLLENGIDPIFVFDGEPPAFKKKTTEMRNAIKKEAELKLEEAKIRGDEEAIRRYAQTTARLTGDMIEQAKTLLTYMGIPIVQAPSEGEAEAAFLTKKGVAWASGSQDWDSLLFGAKRMVKNLTISGRRKIARKEAYVDIKPEVIELEDVLSQLGINRDQMIMIGILIGTDYNPGGVKHIGPKTALKMVKSKSFEEVFKDIQWEFETSPREIFEFFKNPPVEDVKINRPEKNLEKLKDFMLSFDFSEERVEKTLEKIKAQEKEKNESLTKWFK
jgi:flap endonuclease-1